MLKTMLSVIVLALSFSGRAFAADEKTTPSEGQTTIKAEDVKPSTEKNKVTTGEDVDEIITNKKMRAEAGSKSKWSIGTALNYNGSTINNAFSEKRPNLTGANGQTAVAAISGTVGVGYKMTTTDRIGLDAGVRWVTPFSDKAPSDFNGNRVDADNPSITYSKMYKWSNVQSVFSFGPTMYTTSNTRRDGYSNFWTINQNNIIEVGKTGLSLGLYVVGDYYFFDKNDVASKNKQSDYDLGASPFLEYTINDTFNLRTVFNWLGYDHNRWDPNSDRTPASWTFVKEKDTQSVGLGISITRDIFLYPNIQFVPHNISHVFRADETNVALNTNINVF